MIPVKSGNTGYMYDKVRHMLFSNGGSGSFTLGNEINEDEYYGNNYPEEPVTSDKKWIRLGTTSSKTSNGMHLQTANVTPDTKIYDIKFGSRLSSESWCIYIMIGDKGTYARNPNTGNGSYVQYSYNAGIQNYLCIDAYNHIWRQYENGAEIISNTNFPSSFNETLILYDGTSVNCFSIAQTRISLSNPGYLTLVQGGVSDLKDIYVQVDVNHSGTYGYVAAS